MPSESSAITTTGDRPVRASGFLNQGSFPVYSCLHEDAIVAQLELLDYDEINLRNDPKVVLSVLHQLHSLMDELTEKYHLYKVDIHAGRLSLVANVSERIPEPATTMLYCLLEFMTLSRKLSTPYRREVKFRAAVSAGTVLSAVVGTTAMRFGVFGPCEVVTRALLRYGTADCLIAAQSFVNELSSAMEPRADASGWAKLLSIRLPGMNQGSVEVYQLHINFGRTATGQPGQSGTEAASGSAENGQYSDPDTGSTRWGLTMSFPDPDTEKQFRLFQGTRMIDMDAVHLVVSLILMQTVVVRCFQLGFPSHLAFLFTMGALVSTAAPLVAMGISRKSYVKLRTMFMIAARILRASSFVLYNYTAPGLMLGISHRAATFFSRTLIVNLSIVHGMYAVGSQVVLQWHMLTQLFVLAAVGFNSYLACKEDKGETLPECSRTEVMALSLVMQFIMMFLIPTAMVWRVESRYRRLFVESYLEDNYSKKACR